MRTLKHSKTWILLALLSLFSLAAAPAFAFSCCCADAAPAVHHDAPHHADNAKHTTPSCNQHGAAHAVKAPAPCVERVCQCNSEKTVVNLADTARASLHLAALAFAPPQSPQTELAPPCAPRCFAARDFFVPLAPASVAKPGRAPPAI